MRWKRFLFQALTVCLIGLVATMALSWLSGCTALAKVEEPVEPLSFQAYREKTLELLASNRNFQEEPREMEILWNAPREWQPSQNSEDAKPQRGILLVHGLGDSPWSFHDLGPELASEGFLVRTVLLPGHGTHPKDMLPVKAEEWSRLVYQQASELQKDVNGDIYLGGFSTGANLVVSYAYDHPEIAGLVLFSPGFKSFFFDWLAPLISPLRPWIIEPGKDIPLQTPVRYENVPTNGYAQFYRTSIRAQELLERPYQKPVFMAVSQHDSVLDTDYLHEVFKSRFTHPDSRLIWYGDAPEGLTDKSRVYVRSDYLPELRVSQFSHMGLVFSPDNPLYGRDGRLRVCLNSMDGEERKACEQGAELWFSAWGHHEEGKVHARLTFNPYFYWQMSVILSVLGKPVAGVASDLETLFAAGSPAQL